MQVFFHTLGCKVNQYETQQIKENLLGLGYTETHDPKEADVILINSCTVTAESDRKTRQLVRRYKKANQRAVVILAGCMPQAFPKEAEKLPADIIMGNKGRAVIPSAISDFLKTGEKALLFSPHKKGDSFENCKINRFCERTRAYIKIEDGCDRGCAYCIIPKARGRVRSKNLEDIRKEAVTLSKNGFLEIVLVGINLSSYGLDLGLTLADAVEEVAKVEGVKRIRLGSLEPDLTNLPLLTRLKKVDKFCPQFHLSLQSGCDETLSRMNRLYNTKEYKKVVENIRSLWGNAGITTDIMVGFIGETDEEFERSLNFAKEIGFVKAHVFPYSVRVGTAAEKMQGRVEERVKQERAAEMANACNNASLNLFEGLVGTTCEVLFETQQGAYIMGYNEAYVPILTKAEENCLHKILKVKIIGALENGALAEII